MIDSEKERSQREEGCEMATREEELQKKREEAERKARRGEIDPTHDFTIQVSHLLMHSYSRDSRLERSCLFRSWPN